MKILVTGAAGFIGYYATKVLAARGDEVVGLDNINAYYDTRLKYARLAQNGISQDAIMEGQSTASTCYPNYRFIKLDLGNREALQRLFVTERFDRVCNLAAQAGVRYSLKNPYAYADSNLVGFVNLLECCRHHGISHLVYASSSSVYGLNSKVPFSEDDRTDTPVSLYAATKKANELMAHAYSQLYRLPTTGLRFFTVYGPWGRPDMAPMLFSDAITAGRTIKVFNNGELSRDFTYIDDIAEGLVRAIDHTPQGEVPYALYNIGLLAAGAVDGLYPHAGSRHRAQGPDADDAHAGRRRLPDLRRHPEDRTGARLQTVGYARKRHRSVHKMV